MYIRRYLLLCPLMLIVTCMCYAGPDSLRTLLAKSGSGREKAELYQALASRSIGLRQVDSVSFYIDQYMQLALPEDNAFFTEHLTMANKMLFAIGANSTAMQLNDRYLARFAKEKNQERLAAVWYNMGRAALFQGDLPAADSLLGKAERNTGNLQELHTLICLDMGSVYAARSKYTEGLQILTEALEETDSVKYPDTYAGLLSGLGTIQGQIGDKKTSLQYFFRVARMMKEQNPMGYANALINIAASYNDLNELDKAEKNAREAWTIVAQANANPNALSDVLFTLSEVLLKQKKYTEAESIYSSMDSLAAITGNPLTTALSGLGMAHVWYARKEYPKSLQLLQKIVPVLEQNGALYEMVKGYGLLYENYEQLGDYHNAFDAFRKYHTIADSISNEEKVKELTLLQSKFEFQKKEVVYQKERRIRNVVIIALSIIFCLAILLAFFIFKNRQRLNTQKQMELDALLKKTEHELSLSRVQLEDFARNVQEKTRLMEALEQQVLAQSVPDNALVLQLQQSTILTEDDWERFRALFEQVHAGFLTRLRDKYASLSRAEIRFITLAKLKFSTREMAGALGVSPQSIRTNWYRIRKKLEITEEISVEDFVNTI